jgi:radical SAM superfamily enzyme YgiQ (UPF0313 family)
MGIACLSAYAKKHGHKVDLYNAGKIIKKEWTKYEFHDEEGLVKKINDFNPDIIGITVMDTNFDFVVLLSTIIKKHFNIPIILGGPHPTIYPDECIKPDTIDMICIGEGEGALLDLLNAIDKKRDMSKIKNLWVKRKGTIIKNLPRQLIQNLDLLPFPDRDLFGFDDREQFMAGRGCPYTCTYCINHKLIKLYYGQKIVRYRSIENIFKEIRDIDKKRRIKNVSFMDETFTVNKKRVIDFCRAYKKRTGIPFSVQTRANTIDREIMLALKEAGCYMILIGIENADDKIRNEVLRRNMSKEQIRNAFRLAKEFGIQTFSFNMIGVPGETRKTIIQTIEFNKELGTERRQYSIYFPLRGTELGDYCYNNNFVKEKPERDYFIKSFLNLPTMSARMIDSYVAVLPLYYKFSRKFYFVADFVRYVLYPFPAKYKRYPRALFKRLFPMEKPINVPERGMHTDENKNQA